MLRRLKPGDAWDYPWRRMPAILRDNGVLFTVLFICGVVWTIWSSTPQSFHTVYIEWIAGIAALGAAFRGLQPTYRMRPSTIGWIFAFYLGASLLASLLIGLPGILLLFAHQYTLAVTWLLTLLIPMIWIGVKLLATPAFFVLHESEGGTISNAIKLSWQRISGERWLRLFSIQVVIGLCCMLFVALLSLPLFFVLRGFLGVAPTCVYYAIALPAAAFSMTATLAVAASTEPAVMSASDSLPGSNL